MTRAAVELNWTPVNSRTSKLRDVLTVDYYYRRAPFTAILVCGESGPSLVSRAGEKGLILAL